MKSNYVYGMLTSLSLAAGCVSGANATAISGTLYFTSSSPENVATGTLGNASYTVFDATYNYNGSALSLGPVTGVASTTGSDGLLFAPNGNILVAGQNNNLISEVTTGGTNVGTVGAGTGSYHLALASNSPSSILYTMWNGSTGGGSTSIAAVTLTNGGIVGSASGTPYTVSCATGHSTCSTDVRGVVYNATNGKWYYGTSSDSVAGDFGTVVFDNVNHTATLTPLLTNIAAHGLSYDPFSGDIITNMGTTINQIQVSLDGSTATVVSTFTSPTTTRFDQAAVTGTGQLFVASGTGTMQFIDYSASGLIGSGTNYSSSNFLINALDDVAPLSGTGSNQTAAPEPISMALFGTGALGLGWVRRRRGNRIARA